MGFLKKDLDGVHQANLEILQIVGIRADGERAVNLLSDAGAKVMDRKNKIVLFNEKASNRRFKRSARLLQALYARHTSRLICKSRTLSDLSIGLTPVSAGQNLRRYLFLSFFQSQLNPACLPSFPWHLKCQSAIRLDLLHRVSTPFPSGYSWGMRSDFLFVAKWADGLFLSHNFGTIPRIRRLDSSRPGAITLEV